MKNGGRAGGAGLEDHRADDRHEGDGCPEPAVEDLSLPRLTREDGAVRGGLVPCTKCNGCSGITLPVMTQGYAHHYPESLRDAVERLEAGQAVSIHLAQLWVVSDHGPASC